MLVTYSWLKEFVDVRLSAREAADTLTMAGLEVEGLEKAGEDFVLDVNVTPDRPDCLSVLGIARELSAITESPLRMPEHEIREASKSDFRIEILDAALCPRYAGRAVRGVRVAPSPDWMRERLEKCGIRAINNVVDITNYVLIELGHPLHAFDLDALRGGVIRVGAAGKNRSITTLDGMERRLPDSALLIWDAERPVAVAGVMGGADTEVKEGTANIFVESASFAPLSVRRTSRALSLKSESSYRFERGTDIVMLEHALDRAARLVLDIAGGRAEALVEAYPARFQPSSVTVKFDRVNRVLGTDIPHKEMVSVVKRLQLGVKTNRDSFTVTPPSFRHDVALEADVIEEIARLHGYGRIPTVVPRAEISFAGTQKGMRLITMVKEALEKEGFSEAVNFSFMNTDYLDILRLSAGDSRRRCVEIKNPLRKEDSHLRTMLAPSLIENFRHNFSRGVRDIRLFEVARVFEEGMGQLPHEPLRAGGILMKDDSPALYRETAEGFSLVKGAVEAVLESLGLRDVSYVPSTEPFLHPGKAADVMVRKRKAGYAGVLTPAVVERLDIKARQEILLFELDLEALFQAMPEHIAYAPMPRFPSIERDIALLLDEGITSAKVVELARAYPSGLIEEVSVFDSYKGKNIPRGKKSLGIRITYRSPERTLTDEEVEEVHGALLEHLAGKTGGEIRK